MNQCSRALVSVTARRERGKHAPLQQVRGPVTYPLNLVKTRAELRPCPLRGHVKSQLYSFFSQGHINGVQRLRGITDALLERLSHFTEACGTQRKNIF